MNNLSFLKSINSNIYKSNEKFYACIPFVHYDAEKTYIENYNDSIYILLSSEFLTNSDLEYYIKNIDFRYETMVTNDHNSIQLINSHNYVYFSNLNEIYAYEFKEEDVLNLNNTFMIILKDTYRYNNLETTDYLYKYVIDFYANGQYDDALILMSSIFNAPINVTSQNSTCGCNQQSTNCSSNVNSLNSLNTGTELINIDNATCVDKYKAAMYQLLINMLSDAEFYCNWLFIESEDKMLKKVPDTTIIDKLIALLQFALDNFDLSNLGNTNSSYCGHTSSIKCEDVFNDALNNNNCSYYSIIQNYIDVLNYVKNDKVIENKNKIYIYGKRFAEIFPLLKFNY